MAEVLVLVDHLEGEIKKSTYELLTAARALGEPSAVVVGPAGTAGKLADGLKEYGAAKKKPVATLSLADAGIDPAEVGLANALTAVTSAQPKPPKSAGEKVTDEGDGGAKVAAYLVSQKLI